MKNPIKQEFDIVVIGAGPAGLTASIYIARANMKVAIVEKEAPGGKMIKTDQIENYPGFANIKGPDLSIEMYNQALNMGAYFIFKEAISITKNNQNLFIIILNDNSILEAKAVILATGTQENQLLVDGEKKLYGKGVSYCAVCDGAFYRDKVVAVVGGGYSAVTESLFLTQFVKKLYVIVRKDHFRVDKSTLERLSKKPGVEFLMNSQVTKIHGDDKVEKITIFNSQNKKIEELHISAIFPYIGSKPLSNLVSKFSITNKNGYVNAFNDKLETTVSGLFVAGDVREMPLRQIAIATGDGAVTGQMAVEYIQKF